MNVVDSRVLHRPTVLMVYPWCIDHLGHGNIQRMLAMARALSDAGVLVDIVYQGNPRVRSQEAVYGAIFRRIVRVDAWQSSDDARITQQVADFYQGYEVPRASFCPGTALTVAVRGLLDAVDYTAVISSYAWTAPIFEPLTKRALRILDVHDIISLHGARSEEATGERSEFWMPEDTERFLWRKWDVLLAITEGECRDIAPHLRPVQQLLTVGHAVQVPAPSQPPSESLVYAASDNPSNRQSTAWLLGEVWPEVVRRRPSASLQLVGLICTAIENLPIAKAPNLTLRGFVDDPVAAVGAASIVLAPYLYGSGLKVKVVEAAGTGRPIVTTAAGVEGTGMRDGEHLLVADGAEAFADAIVRLLDDPELRQRLGDAGRRHVSHAFSVDACYGALIEIIQSRSAESSKPGLIPSSVEARIGELLAVLQPPPGLVVWGNGSHTRALLHVLGRLNAPVRCVVDKSAAAESLSPEGVRVVAPSHFRPERGDVILLSSQTFEPQMWKDVSLVRGEAQAMALYRRELITPELKQRLPGAKPHRPHVAAAVASASSRLVLLEPSAGKRGGHFYRPAQALQLVAAQRSMSVVLAGSRRVSLEGLSQEEQGLIEPTFESSFWDVLPATSDDTWPQIARSSKLFAHDLARLAARLTLREDDVVMVAMANILEVLGVAQWLGSSAARSFPEIRLLFHFLPHHEAAWLKTSEPEIRHAYRLALAMLDDQTGERLRILAQSSALATGLEEVFGRRVDPVGYPLSSPTPVARNGRSPYRLLFAGEARSDKGFALLPDLADALAAELGDGRVQLVCQAKLNAFADDTLKAAVGTLAMRPGITIIEEYLPTESYEALIAGSDLVVLPYDPEQYRARLSAVFVDATCAGVAVAVPAETWMASQLELGLGAGERFLSVAADDIADAVRRAMASRGDIEQAAQQAAARARAQHDPAAVLDGILARARVAA